MSFQPGFLGGGPTPASFTQSIVFSTALLSTVNQATHTYTATTVGTASTDRLIVVTAMAGGVVAASSFVSATINSSAATLVTQSTIAGGAATAIFQMALPTTHTAVDIGVTWSSSVGNSAISVYVLTGLLSQTVSTFGSDLASTSSAFTVALNRPDGGVGVAAVRSSVTEAHTWTAPFAVTFDTSIEAASVSGSMLPVGGNQAVNAQVVTTSTGAKILTAAIWA